MNNTKDLKRKIFDALNNLYKVHGEEVTSKSHFFCYGILIGLAAFGKDFFIEHWIIAALTSICAVGCLVTVHIYSTYIFIKSNSILKRKYDIKLDTLRELYRNMKSSSMSIFIIFQTFFVLSVLLFLMSSYVYYYGYPCSNI
jgi:hypothetical protein